MGRLTGDARSRAIAELGKLRDMVQAGTKDALLNLLNTVFRFDRLKSDKGGLGDALDRLMRDFKRDKDIPQTDKGASDFRIRPQQYKDYTGHVKELKSCLSSLHGRFGMITQEQRYSRDFLCRQIMRTVEVLDGSPLTKDATKTMKRKTPSGLSRKTAREAGGSLAATAAGAIASQGTSVPLTVIPAALLSIRAAACVLGLLKRRKGYAISAS